MQSHFHINGLPLSLALKQRPGVLEKYGLQIWYQTLHWILGWTNTLALPTTEENVLPNLFQNNTKWLDILVLDEKCWGPGHLTAILWSDSAVGPKRATREVITHRFYLPRVVGMGREGTLHETCESYLCPSPLGLSVLSIADTEKLYNFDLYP